MSSTSTATKHTPTPWERCDAFGPSATGLSVKSTADDMMICSTTGYYGRDGAGANAAFIVRAANAHEQLVAALRSGHRAIDILMAHLIEVDPTFMPTQSAAWPLLVAVNSALAAAEA